MHMQTLYVAPKKDTEGHHREPGLKIRDPRLKNQATQVNKATLDLANLHGHFQRVQAVAQTVVPPRARQIAGILSGIRSTSHSRARRLTQKRRLPVRRR